MSNGEERSSGLAQAINAFKYLQSIGKNDSIEAHEAKEAIYEGYQSILNMKAEGNSFNMWKNTKSDSVWLTAYIVQLLSDARKIIKVDDKVIEDSLNYLKTMQGKDGSFDDKSLGTFRNLVSGLSKTYLTSFVLMALLKDQKNDTNSAVKAINYLTNNSTKFNYDYDHIIAAYALSLGGKANEADKIYGNIKYHYKTSTHSNKEGIFIEIASYVTLLNLHKNNIPDALENVKWLINHRVKNGGFPSSFDNYMGLNAIAAFLTQSGSVDATRASLKISTNNDMQTLDVKNVLDTKYKELMGLGNNTQVNLQFKGKGLIYANFWYQYALTNTEETSNFYEIDAPIEKITENENMIDIKLKTNVDSKMVVVEVSLPSGFIYVPGTYSRNVKVGN